MAFWFTVVYLTISIANLVMLVHDQVTSPLGDDVNLKMFLGMIAVAFAPVFNLGVFGSIVWHNFCKWKLPNPVLFKHKPKRKV